MSRPLFAIAEDVIRFSDLLEEADGDLSKLGEFEAAVTAWMDSLGDEQAQKLDSYLNLMKTLAMEAAAARAEAEQFALKARYRETAEKRLRDRLKLFLEVTGQTKVQTASGRTIAIQKNGGKAPLVFDPAVPVEEYAEKYAKTVTTKTPNVEAIRADLEAGAELAFAKIGEVGSHLRIK